MRRRHPGRPPGRPDRRRRRRSASTTPTASRTIATSTPMAASTAGRSTSRHGRLRLPGAARGLDLPPLDRASGVVAIQGWGTADTEALVRLRRARRDPVLCRRAIPANLTDPTGEAPHSTKAAPYNFFYGPSYSDACRALVSVGLEGLAGRGQGRAADVWVHMGDNHPYPNSPKEACTAYAENRVGLRGRRPDRLFPGAGRLHAAVPDAQRGRGGLCLRRQHRRLDISLLNSCARRSASTCSSSDQRLGL